ncbi:MAG: Holliday junction resolvase RuvX [Akkermansiaceae bacterium]
MSNTLNYPDQSAHPALGLDYGESRIGVAATDDFGILAHPVETIPAYEISASIQRITELVETKKSKNLVIGLPLRLDGSEGESVKKVRKFAAKLQAKLPNLPIHYVDESFTTSDAASKLHEAGRNAKKQKGLIDQAAAVEILNRWMEELS